MLDWSIVAIGRFKSGPEEALFTHHAARCRPKLGLKEIPEARGSAPEIKRREAEALLAAIPTDALVVALDQDGQTPGSADLAKLLDRWQQSGKKLRFVIGGAEGLDRSVLDRADATLSLGAMTWPHLLVRGMLAEQLFRAQSILAGHPYHRAGRP